MEEKKKGKIRYFDRNNYGKKLDYKNLNRLIHIGLVFGIVGLVLLGLFFLQKFKILKIIFDFLKILSPLFIGILVAWLLEPFIRLLEKQKVKRWIGTILTYLIMILLLVLLMILVVPEFVSQLSDLVDKVPGFITSISNTITNISSKLPNSELDVKTIQTEIVSKLEKVITGLTTESLSNVVSFISTFLSSLANVVIGMIIGFYISLEFDKFVKTIYSFIPRKKRKNAQKLFASLNDMAYGYVIGTLFSSSIVALFTFIGLLISGVSSPLLFAIFCGITNIIPYFGPYIGGIPTILVAFSISPVCGFITTGVILIVQFVEGDILNPIIIGKATDIHPLTTIIGLIIFEYYLGILGMIIATPIIGAVKILFNYFNDKYDITDLFKPVNLEETQKLSKF